ncbi:Acyl-CoA N-acyltransferase [Phytophthora cactorum]|nr:Acyl-CoA N-acyltransferase [Phytophthora cactorum]
MESSSYLEVASPVPVMASGLNVRRRKIEIEVEEGAARGPTWQFPRSGTSQHVHVPESELADIQHQLDQPRKLLSEWPATAISGNDILGSVLYAAASVVAKAGKLMPVSLLMVAIVLYFFRFIYEEVVTAIPMNGGTYNALLNTTSKRAAAVAACLSILSYVATGVVSATSGVHYLDTQVDIPIVACTIALLFAFALLALVGIAENSRVALVIFLHHIVVLTILVVSCAVHSIKNPHIFRDNMNADFPEVDFAGTMLDGNAFTATLRNMWALASFFNVCLGVGILAVLPLGGDDGIYASADALLSKAAEVSLGSWFSTWVSVDAFVVLSGSVLTSYVGICGLVRRLATDRVLPSFLAKTNELRGTNHYIIAAFFLLSASLVLVLNADSSIMNGVYTYAFLGLMALFASAAMLLKAKRPEIPRDVIAPWSVLVLGLGMVVAAIFANLLGDPSVLMYFALYFIAVALVMFIMFERVMILRCLLALMKKTAPSQYAKDTAVNYFRTRDTPEVEHTGARGGRTIARAITSIRSAPIVFFCKRPDLTIINKVIVYVRRNEQTHTLRIVHVFSVEESDAPVLATFRNLAVLFDSMYPKIRIDFVSVQGEFKPATIEWLSKKMDVPRNMMFITQPDMVSAERAEGTICRRQLSAMGVTRRALGLEVKSLQYFLNRTAVLKQYREFLRTTKPLAADVRLDVRRQIRAGFDTCRNEEDERRVSMLLRQAREQLKMVSDLVDTAQAQQRSERDWKKGDWTSAKAVDTQDSWMDTPSEDKDGTEDVKGRIAEAEIAAMRKAEEEEKAAAASEKDDSDDELARQSTVVDVQLLSGVNVSHCDDVGLGVFWTLHEVDVEAPAMSSAVVDVPRQDVRAVQSVHVDTVTQLHEYLSKWPDYFLVQEDPNNTIMGYIMGKAEGQGTNWHGHVTAVTVAPEFRRLGLAKKLMDYLENVSVELYDAYFVDLFVRVSNSLAIGMYEKFGYSVYRRVLGYYSSADDGEDAFGTILWGWILNKCLIFFYLSDMRKALPRDVHKKSIIPLPHPITPDQL